MLKQLKLAQHVSFTQLDDEAVLLDLHSGSYYGLNHVGVKLIKALENGVSSQSAIEEISSSYDTPIEQVQVDVSSLLQEMVDNKLLIEV